MARYYIDLGICIWNFTGKVAATLDTLRPFFRLSETFVKSYIKKPTTNPKKASKVAKVSKHEFHAQKAFLYIRGHLVFFGLICWYPKLVMKKKVKKAKVAREPNHNNLLSRYSHHMMK